MLRTFVNKDAHTRIWPSLSHPDGHTLALGPGEKVDLDLPDAFDDPHLKLVRGQPKQTDTHAEPAQEPEAAPELTDEEHKS